VNDASEEWVDSRKVSGQKPKRSGASDFLSVSAIRFAIHICVYTDASVEYASRYLGMVILPVDGAVKEWCYWRKSVVPREHECRVASSNRHFPSLSRMLVNDRDT